MLRQFFSPFFRASIHQPSIRVEDIGRARSNVDVSCVETFEEVQYGADPDILLLNGIICYNQHYSLLRNISITPSAPLAPQIGYAFTDFICSTNKELTIKVLDKRSLVYHCSGSNYLTIRSSDTGEPLSIADLERGRGVANTLTSEIVVFGNGSVDISLLHPGWPRQIGRAHV